MSASGMSRRTLIKTTALGLAGATLDIGAIGRALAAKDLTVGIVYVGARDDFGWNQAHAVAIQALKEVPGVKVVEEENVPETDAVSKSMESMINLDGAGLILATSFGYYTPFVVDLAKKYPDVEFRHAAPLWNKDKDPKNAGSYFGYLNQAHLCRRRRRRPLAPSPTRSASSPPSRSPACSRNINSVLLGARSTNPKATVQVIFTGDWSMPVREAEAANALVDAGCDVITCHVDGPKVVIETAEKRGVMSCGHNASQAPLAPKGFITGAEYKWETIYKGYATDLAAGKHAAELPDRRLRGRLRPATRRSAPPRRPKRRRPPTPPSRAAQGARADLRRPDQGQQGQGGHRQDLRQPRSVPRQDGLPARRRRRLDDLRPADRERAPVSDAPLTPVVRLGPDRASRSGRGDLRLGAAPARPVGICRHPAAGDRRRGGGCSRSSCSRSASLRSTSRLCLARRLRHRVLLPEHAAALRAADPDRARVAIPARIGLIMIGGEGALVIGGFAAAALAIPMIGGRAAVHHADPDGDRRHGGRRVLGRRSPASCAMRAASTRRSRRCC